MTVISDIPTASDLHTQLDALTRAIELLRVGNGTVTNLTVAPPPQPPPEPPDLTEPPTTMPEPPVMPIAIFLDPPISNPASISALITGMQAQADLLTQQLVNMGYESGGPVTVASSTRVYQPRYQPPQPPSHWPPPRVS